jgi:molecular chaperone DnaK (HSP70)
MSADNAASPASPHWHSARPARRPRQVTFRVDGNGILSVEAKDLGMEDSEVRITPTAASPADIDRLVDDAAKFRQATPPAELAELKSQARHSFIRRSRH